MKVTIEIVDRAGGGVSVTCDPPVADLLQKHYKSVDGCSPGESYAIWILNNLRDTSKAMERAESPLSIPGKIKPY